MNLPFAPGESPFRVKGSIFRGCAEHINAKVPGGMPAVVRALPSAVLRPFWAQAFLASAWYDAFMLDPLLSTAAQLVGLRYEAFLAETFEAQAERDQRGVYKLLLHAISPEMLVKRLPRIGSQIFDFTRSEVQELGPGHWQNAISGVPTLLQTLYCESSAAFVSRALRTTGARELQHRWLEPRPAPSAHGIAICTVVRELRWRT